MPSSVQAGASFACFDWVQTSLNINFPGWQSAVNPMYFKNQGSDAGRHSTVAGLPATLGCQPKINDMMKFYTSYSTVAACIWPLTALCWGRSSLCWNSENKANSAFKLNLKVGLSLAITSFGNFGVSQNWFTLLKLNEWINLCQRFIILLSVPYWADFYLQPPLDFN